MIPEALVAEAVKAAVGALTKEAVGPALERFLQGLEGPGRGGGVECALEATMPRPYSVDLRERVLLACEAGGDSCAAVARRFRVAISTLHLWRKQARDEGRRAPRRMGRGPAPLGGGLEVLAALAAERNDATLAE